MHDFTCTHLIPPVCQKLQSVLHDCKNVCVGKMPQLGPRIKIILSSVGPAAVLAQHTSLSLY